MENKVSPTEAGLLELLMGHLVPMLGAALLGALFDWLLSLNLANKPQLLHGGLWLLILGLLGTYLDFRAGIPRSRYLQGAPEMFVILIFFLMNLSFAFWVVMILAGLGLGFETSVIDPILKWALGFISFMAIMMIGMELDNRPR